MAPVDGARQPQDGKPDPAEVGPPPADEDVTAADAADAQAPDDAPQTEAGGEGTAGFAGDAVDPHEDVDLHEDPHQDVDSYEDPARRGRRFVRGSV